MIIGIPKEIKNNENRVALPPSGVFGLTNLGHKVLVETKAGLGSAITDEEYYFQVFQVLHVGMLLLLVGESLV